MSDIAPVLSKEFLDIQETIECKLTLKRVHDMTRTYSLRVPSLTISIEQNSWFPFFLQEGGGGELGRRLEAEVKQAIHLSLFQLSLIMRSI